MPTTSNFGWTTPADTDLVKDGAAAIRTLGNGVDSSFVDLKGGTSGQILSKNSNTDLDFVWIANDVGDITNVGVTAPITGGGSSGSVTIGIDDGTTAQKGAVQLEDSTSSTSTTKAATPNSVKSAYDLANAAIPKSLVDAAGDLIYGTAADTLGRLAIGTAGQVLAVNSGATAPEWVTSSGGTSWTLLNSGGTALTGAQTITITGISAKNDLFIYFTGASSASNSEIGFRFNTDTGNNYRSFGVLNKPTTTYSTAVFDAEDRTSTSKIRSVTALASGTAAGYLYVTGANTSGIKTVWGAGGTTSGDGTRQYILGGFYESASTITSVSLNSETGNFDAGTIYVYTSA